MPIISIIVPVYNVSVYLRQCVDSILSQTMSDFELILVDDGSSDDSPNICDEYLKIDKRIRVIHQINAGTSAARNAGIDISSGDYICFIDGDDVISPDYCSVLYSTIVAYNCHISLCSMKRFIDPLPNIHINENEGESVILFSRYELLLSQIKGKAEIGVCNKLFDRSVFNNIRFLPGRRYEDILFSADLLSLDLRAAYVDLPLYYYRQNPDSFMKKQLRTEQCSPDWVYAVRYLINKSESVNFPYPEECLLYAIKYPWSFIDPIYVNFRFIQNKEFMDSIQSLINEHLVRCKRLDSLDLIQRKRMSLYAKSKVLYGFNAYARLFRVYLYHLLKLDAYSDGHGI